MNGAGVYLAEVKERFSSLDYPVSPCSEEEIAALESRLGFSLPVAYREFLAWMGRRAEGFMVGTDFYYAELWDAREYAVELLRENDAPEALPKDAVIILLHQGYTFAFIRAGEGDDPPVYFYTESQNDDRFTRVSPHYSDYLQSLLERHLDYVKEFGSVSPELE
ncbi:MAG: SMI1/KNR4 family protein [Anaerolineales bacterium]